MKNWKFNKDYKDYGQVEQFYPLFLKLHNDITSSGEYPYNSLFEGKLGIENKEEEKTAIYLLQQSNTEKNRQAKIKELLKDGFKHITKGEETVKYNNIVQVGTDYSRASIKEFEKAKIVFKDGDIRAIVPKGHRTRGYFIWPDRLIFAK